MSFLIGENIQDAAAKKEEAKINRMREMQEERRNRVMNTKERTIGVSIEGLNLQSKQNQYQKDMEKERLRFEKIKMLEIERVLALREQEDLKLKQQEKEKLKDSWNDSIKHKNMQLNEEKKEKNTFIHTSLSGAQPMHGEDDNQSIRIKAQQEQIRLDYQKSLSEHDDAKKRNQLIELGFAQMDQYSYEIRTKTEENEIEARRKANIEVREQNSECARRNQELRQSDTSSNISPDERAKFTSLNLYNEDRNQAVDSDGRVIKGRIDCFKGLTTAAVKQIYKENDYVVQEKQAAILRDQNEERSHTDYQALLQSHLDKTFEEEYLARRQARQEQALYLQKQAQEQAQSHSLLQQDKFGKIDGGYYSNFGKSCR